MIFKRKDGAFTDFEIVKDTFRITHYRDISGILEQNREMRKDETQQNGFSADRELRWIGEIPIEIYVDHCRKYPEARDPSTRYWTKFLSRPENECFRTVPKILGGKTKFA